LLNDGYNFLYHGDPLQRSHDLGTLIIAAFQKGNVGQICIPQMIDQDSMFRITYSPSWASHINVSLSCRNFGKLSLLEKMIVQKPDDNMILEIGSGTLSDVDELSLISNLLTPCEQHFDLKLGPELIETQTIVSEAAQACFHLPA
jgi:hypothetical protein